MGKGKAVSIYLSDEEIMRVEELKKQGYNNHDAVKRVLYDRDQMLHKDHEAILRDHEDILRILENIRASPILQVGSKTPVVTVQTPAAERASWLTRIGKRLHRKQSSDE